MATLFIIIGVAAFIGGFISGNKKYNKMTPQQRREHDQKTMETFAGLLTGMAVGTVAAGKKILDGSNGNKRRKG